MLNRLLHLIDEEADCREECDSELCGVALVAHEVYLEAIALLDHVCLLGECLNLLHLPLSGLDVLLVTFLESPLHLVKLFDLGVALSKQRDLVRDGQGVTDFELAARFLEHDVGLGLLLNVVTQWCKVRWQRLVVEELDAELSKVSTRNLHGRQESLDL